MDPSQVLLQAEVNSNSDDDTSPFLLTPSSSPLNRNYNYRRPLPEPPSPSAPPLRNPDSASSDDNSTASVHSTEV
jgi:hypothetical protein